MDFQIIKSLFNYKRVQIINKLLSAKPSPKLQHEQEFTNGLRKLCFSHILRICFLGKYGLLCNMTSKLHRKSYQIIELY